MTVWPIVASVGRRTTARSPQTYKSYLQHQRPMVQMQRRRWAGAHRTTYTSAHERAASESGAESTQPGNRELGHAFTTHDRTIASTRRNVAANRLGFPGPDGRYCRPSRDRRVSSCEYQDAGAAG